MTESDARLLGRYQLLAKLATGGMAEIHLAKQVGIEGLERLVVIKKILPHLIGEQRFLEMFLDEARITIQLNHQNIVQTYDLGQEDGQYFLALEYLEGESLGYLIREARDAGKTLPPELAASIVASVADGLEYAHSLNDHDGNPLSIVHRDVSPQNIIVLFNGGVKLVDFGIAKAASKVHRTQVGTMKGKLVYMAPEQCKGAELDRRADIFSLGAVLWELLARRRLFKRDNEAAIIQAVVMDEAPPVRKFQPDVPAVLEAVALRALSKDPTDRFSDCAEMAAALRDYLRRSQAAASSAEVSEFINGVFADRARTKKALLEKIKASGGEDISLEILKPDTSESLPSRSSIDQSVEVPQTPSAMTRKELLAAETQVSDGKLSQRVDLVEGHADGPADPLTDDNAELVATQTKLRQAGRKNTGLWAGVVALLLIVVGGGLWIISSPGGGSAGAKPGGDPGVVIENPDEARPVLDGANSAIDAGVAQPTVPDGGTADKPSDEKAVVKATVLNVKSTPPGCLVLVDGVKHAQRTPVASLEVEPGVEHLITVVCDGHHKESKSMVAGAGQTIKLSFAPTVLPKKGRAYGKLRLDSEPWSVVYLGRRKLGMTPILGARLPAGRHKLTLINKDEGLKKPVSVVIKPGKTTTVYKKLDK